MSKNAYENENKTSSLDDSRALKLLKRATQKRSQVLIICPAFVCKRLQNG